MMCNESIKVLCVLIALAALTWAQCSKEEVEGEALLSTGNGMFYCTRCVADYEITGDRVNYTTLGGQKISVSKAHVTKIVDTHCSEKIFK